MAKADKEIDDIDLESWDARDFAQAVTAGDKSIYGESGYMHHLEMYQFRH